MLAAAHAECGEFDEAVRYQTEAIGLPPGANEAALAEGGIASGPVPLEAARYFQRELQTRLDCYRSGKRFERPALIAQPQTAGRPAPLPRR
jgi:hypothetical protein